MTAVKPSTHDAGGPYLNRLVADTSFSESIKARHVVARSGNG